MKLPNHNITKSSESPQSRRDFIRQSVLAAAGATVSLDALALVPAADLPIRPDPATPIGAYSVNLFSKSLHWLDWAGMASAVAAMGFDGIDLTVRPNGHVLPERVAEDLPKAVDIIKKAGLNVYMITTAITSADEPYTEAILKAAGSLGIGYYRMGWIEYDGKKRMEENIKTIQSQLVKLAALNKKYNLHGGYQNHSGANFGSPVWDLWMNTKDIDPRWLGSQYDILHAVVEGANSWPLGLRLLKSHVRTMDIKDFHWSKTDSGWKAEVVPLGDGMIDYKRYLSLIKEYNIAGPFSLHFEYDLGGAENGGKTTTMKPEEIFAKLKKDVVTFRNWIRNAGLVS
jgi:L-ribulose-5-phosphate 3-epimerase